MNARTERPTGQWPAQHYEVWFIDYPKTHRHAGQTVEVLVHRVHEDAMREAIGNIDFWRTLKAEAEWATLTAQVEQAIAWCETGAEPTVAIHALRKFLRENPPPAERESS